MRWISKENTPTSSAKTRISTIVLKCLQCKGEILCSLADGMLFLSHPFAIDKLIASCTGLEIKAKLHFRLNFMIF